MRGVKQARQRLDLSLSYLEYRRIRYSVPAENGRGEACFAGRGEEGERESNGENHARDSLRHCLLAINHLKYSDPQTPGALVIVILSLRTESGSETLQVISDGDSRPGELRSTASRHC